MLDAYYLTYRRRRPVLKYAVCAKYHEHVEKCIKFYVHPVNAEDFAYVCLYVRWIRV